MIVAKIAIICIALAVLIIVLLGASVARRGRIDGNPDWIGEAMLTVLFGIADVALFVAAWQI